MGWDFDQKLPRAFEQLWRYVDLLAPELVDFPEQGEGHELDRLHAVLRKLSDCRIGYQWEPALSAFDDTQTIRSPEEILAEAPRTATCIDLCALAAACYLRAGFHPYIVCGIKNSVAGVGGSGHAWLVVDLHARSTKFAFDGAPNPERERRFATWERHVREDEEARRPARADPETDLIEEVAILRTLAVERPERYVTLDVELLAVHEQEDPEDVEGRVARTTVDAAARFDVYDRCHVSDVGWWWRSSWVLPRPGGAEQRGTARTGRPIGTVEERAATSGSQPDRTVLIVDDEHAEAIADLLPGWNRVLTWDSKGAKDVLDDPEQRIDVAVVDIMLDEDGGTSGRGVAAHANWARPLLPKVGASMNFKIGDHERTAEKTRLWNAFVELFHKPAIGANQELATAVGRAAKVPHTDLALAQVERLAAQAGEQLGAASPGVYEPPGWRALEAATTGARQAIKDLAEAGPVEDAALVEVLRRLEATLDGLQAST